MNETNEGSGSPDSSINEQERKTPTIVAYRDNTMFQQYGEAIIQATQTEGRSVGTKIFPIGTERGIIREWVGVNKNDFSGKAFLCDETVLKDAEAAVPYKMQINLDKIMHKAAVETVLGDKILPDGELFEIFEEGRGSKLPIQENFSRQKVAYKALLEKVPEEKKNLEVFIINVPVSEEQRFGFKHLAGHEGYYDEKRYASNDALAKMLEEAFKESGFAKVNIITDKKALDQESISVEGVIVVYDRHSDPAQIGNRHLALRTPLATFFADAIDKLGVVGLDHNMMADAINRQISEKLVEIDAKK